MQRALCIGLPEWPIQRLIVARPELKPQPIALHARDPGRGRIIVACCDRARQIGIAHGMPLAEASTLTKRSRGTSGQQDTMFCEHDPEADREALAELAVWCEQFSPIVGLEQDKAPACLLLDLTGLAPIFGGEPRIIDLVHKAFAKRHYQVRLGLGDTVGAAWGVAHFGKTSAPLQAGQDLTELPVEALRLEANTLDTLQQLGIQTIGQLLQLPRKAVATRLGEQLIQRLDQLLGKHTEVIVAHRPTPEFEVEWMLEHPTRRRDAIETILQSLSQQLSQVLATHDHAVVQAEAVLYGCKTSHRLMISLFQPSSQAQHLFDLLKLQAETAQFREPIHRVQLSATATVRIHGGQQLLWDDLDASTGQTGQREVGALVDRLSSRLGKDSVFGVCAQAGALPEKAYRKKSLASTLRQRKSKTATILGAAHRPLWLHDPPQPLHVRPLTNRDVQNQPPQVFQFENQNQHVVRHWGPERIETGWWRGRTVRRDYYRVETTEGGRFWLFRRVDDGHWFLHGCFE